MAGANEPLRIEEFPEPEVRAGEILISTIYSEICGTDVHLKHGRLSGVPYPIIPGHVSVGSVERTGGDVRDVYGTPISIGDVVTFLDVHNTCNHCWYCLVAKTSTKCPERKVYGITHSSGEGLLGGWSEKVLLHADVKTIRLPREITPLRFIAAGCALPTALHAAERAAIRVGEIVVVQGAGPVGLCAAILAKRAGAQQVFIVDKSETRLELARRFGLDAIAATDASHPDSHITTIIQASHGRGADAVIEATGVPAAVKEGIAMTRDGGRYVIVGHYTDTGEVSINPHTDINRKHLDIRGTWGCDFSHFHYMIEVLKQPEAVPGFDASWEHIVSRVYGLDDIEAGLQDVERGRIVKAVISPNGL
ncbi:MAG: zinc-binding dehydrogenase [Gammaproteobacteria bacterium]